MSKKHVTRKQLDPHVEESYRRFCRGWDVRAGERRAEGSLRRLLKTQSRRNGWLSADAAEQMMMIAKRLYRRGRRDDRFAVRMYTRAWSADKQLWAMMQLLMSGLDQLMSDLLRWWARVGPLLPQHDGEYELDQLPPKVRDVDRRGRRGLRGSAEMLFRRMRFTRQAALDLRQSRTQLSERNTRRILKALTRLERDTAGVCGTSDTSPRRHATRCYKIACRMHRRIYDIADHCEAELAALPVQQRGWPDGPRQGERWTNWRGGHAPPDAKNTGARLLTAPGRAADSTPTHSTDFTSVIWFGRPFEFEKGQQAKSVGLLWAEWEKGPLTLSEKTIGEKIGSSNGQFRLAHVFRGHPAWGTMIQRKRKGVYALQQLEERPV